jgi:hypothetical protein
MHPDFQPLALDFLFFNGQYYEDPFKKLTESMKCSQDAQASLKVKEPTIYIKEDHRRCFNTLVTSTESRKPAKEEPPVAKMVMLLRWSTVNGRSWMCWQLWEEMMSMLDMSLLLPLNFAFTFSLCQ